MKTETKTKHPAATSIPPETVKRDSDPTEHPPKVKEQTAEEPAQTEEK